MKDYEIPLLEKEDIECRVQSVSKNIRGQVGAVLLLYKDARVDMRILDKVFGVGNWQRTHEVINDNLFCNIDIWDEEKKAWIRKQDVGTESNTEKEKGQASDAFKRAGFNVGIGRELYTAPFIYVVLEKTEYTEDTYGGKTTYKCRTKFEVSHIAYNDRREITELVIVDGRGNVRFEQLPPQPKYKKPTKKEVEKMFVELCEDCGKEIKDTKAKAGNIWPVEEIVAYSQRRYEKTLCPDCQKKAEPEIRKTQ